MTHPTPDAVRRPCHHPRAHHQHGTRAAYVADRCRCSDCREANRADAAARRRAVAYGRWQPFVDAAPARRHIERLRAAGVGINRIVGLSGVGSGTVRQLVYGDRRTGTPTARIRPETAAAILAVPLTRPAVGALVPAGRTHALLTDLLEAGHPLPVLARLLGRTTSSLAATLARARVTAGTADAVVALFRSLTPQPRRRSRAATVTDRLGWPAGDSDDTDDLTGDDDLAGGDVTVDEVAVERAMAGEPVTLTLVEQLEAVRRLHARGLSDRRIALLLRTSARTVSRRKSATA
ncbi:helix-turn-helix domain containing protein [Kineosporia sp. A_224]|uniref:helix-turn-helix domain containing protein n=1 Tax=Kineosporia sp. A_224 TaxID=1962180 RepID=UPI000B4B7C3A|nr:helix-turn-helix domain containing protein [Kineosporia sp. A_224]